MHFKTKALELLRTGVGDASADFRPDQWEAINLLLNRRRLLLVEATGWGKSYVYFIVCKILRDQMKGLTVLVSPLLSLMRNQLLAAKGMNICAYSINSSNKNEWDEIYDLLQEDQVDLLFVSPERLANSDFLDFFMKNIIHHLNFLIVDEAHCISDWGHDFRPDYQRIKRVINFLPANIPVLATTATANDRVVEDISSQFHGKFAIMRGNLMRKSIALENILIPDPFERMAWLSKAIKQLPGSGIVYVLTTRYAETIADWLIENGINALAYHSRIEEKSQNSRKEIEDLFLTNNVKVLVATVALGMGYDKPDISFVIHFHRPASVVHYYQQVGRAGRALENAWGFLLQGDEDKEINDYFIERAYPPHQFIEKVLWELENYGDGLNKKQISIRTNLTGPQVEQVLKLLSVVSPSPISYETGKYYRNGINYEYPYQKVNNLKELRYHEQEKMVTYMNHNGCLMRFLAKELDDPYLKNDCGKCSNCITKSLITVNVENHEIIKARLFVKSKPLIIKPRKRFPRIDELCSYREIPYNLQKNSLMIQEGRILCRYHDPGLGKMVSDGKYKKGRFDELLIKESANLIKNRWFEGEQLPFSWLTCIPSRKHPRLVPDFAQRLGKLLGLEFILAIESTGMKKHDQKTMNNSALKLINLDGEYRIDKKKLKKDSVLLVDDMIESGWTLNLAGILLKESGFEGEVYPFALAKTREM